MTREQEQEQRIDALRWQLIVAKSALENWGRHHAHCAKNRNPMADCSCGYSHAISAATDTIATA